MSGSDKFMEIFGNLERNDVDAVPSRSRSNTSTGNDVFNFKLEEYDRSFSNRGFLHDDADDETSTSPKSSKSPQAGGGGGGGGGDGGGDGNGTATAEPKVPQPDYNPYDHVVTEHPTSFWGTIFHIMFLSAGSTMLLLPHRYVATGFVTASVAMLVTFAFYAHSMRMLLWSAHEMCKLKRVPTISYPNLVYEAFVAGPPTLRPLASAARFLINSVFFCGWFGGCVIVYVLIAQNVRAVCGRWPAVAHLTQPNAVLLIFAPILALNLIRRLKFLEPCSTLGFALNSVATLLTVYYALADAAPWKGAAALQVAGSLNTVPLFVGVLFINIDVVGLTISLKNEMKHPHKFEAPCGVMTVAYALIMAIYCVFGAFFALKYGGDVPENAIAIIPATSALSSWALLFYAVGLYLLFPLLLYVPLDTVLNGAIRRCADARVVRHQRACEYALRVLLVTLAAIFAYVDLNISFFVAFFGTVTSSVDCVVFPALIQSLVEWQIGARGKMTAFVLAKNSIIIVSAGCLIVAGIGDCIRAW